MFSSRRDEGKQEHSIFVISIDWIPVGLFPKMCAKQWEGKEGGDVYVCIGGCVCIYMHIIGCWKLFLVYFSLLMFHCTEISTGWLLTAGSVNVASLRVQKLHTCLKIMSG